MLIRVGIAAQSRHLSLAAADGEVIFLANGRVRIGWSKAEADKLNPNIEKQLCFTFYCAIFLFFSSSFGWHLPLQEEGKERF